MIPVVPESLVVGQVVLGIETSCDETAVGIVSGSKVLVNEIASSSLRHKPFGGVIPEIAARAHLEYLPDLLELALVRAGICLHDIDAIAVTAGPGLVTSLSVGVSAAKVLGLVAGKPVYGVNHLSGHAMSAFLDDCVISNTPGNTSSNKGPSANGQGCYATLRDTSSTPQQNTQQNPPRKTEPPHRPAHSHLNHPAGTPEHPRMTTRPETAHPTVTIRHPLHANLAPTAHSTGSIHNSPHGFPVCETGNVSCSPNQPSPLACAVDCTGSGALRTRNDSPIQIRDCVVLLASGGHSCLLKIQNGAIDLLGETLDDAAGEAFDKVARLMGLDYPGGPAIECLARSGNPNAVEFPRAFLKPVDPTNRYNFSFSGLKTAVGRFMGAAVLRSRAGVDRTGQHTSTKSSTSPHTAPEDIAASFQEAVADVLTAKAVAAALDNDLNLIVLGGGVAANTRVREMLQERALAHGLEVRIPPLSLCTDNGAMIAGVGSWLCQLGAEPSDPQFSPVSLMPPNQFCI